MYIQDNTTAVTEEIFLKTMDDQIVTILRAKLQAVKKTVATCDETASEELGTETDNN